jgi:hypothetical protein
LGTVSAASERRRWETFGLLKDQLLGLVVEFGITGRVADLGDRVPHLHPEGTCDFDCLLGGSSGFG